MRLFSLIFRKTRANDLPSEFDEIEYLRLNPEIAAAVARREFKSGAAHWLYLGRYEGRPLRCQPADDQIPEHRRPEARPVSELPLDFDEATYLCAYPDVAAAVADRWAESGAAHWLEHGRLEGRRCWARVTREELPQDFDEATYLQLNPDIAAMVARNAVESGASYSLMRGRYVHTSWKTNHSRQQRDQAGTGFQGEICAKFYPDVGEAYHGDPESLLQHWRLHGAKEGRTPFGFCPYQTRRMSSDFLKRRNAITLYGFFDEPTGLGSSARGYRSALRDAGYEITSVTIYLKDGRFDTTPDVRDDSEFAAAKAGQRDKINIFHINADMVHNFFWDQRLHLLDDCFNIAIWFWELAYFRPDWASAFGAFDEIWVSSEFCRAAISSVSPIPVVTIPLSVEVDRTAPVLPRSYFRVPNDVFVFGCIFDVGSVVERKNPEAAINAFIKAFGERSDVLLVLKYHSAHHYPEPIKRLHGLIAGRDNIRIYGRQFDHIEINSFKCLIDCYLSPHRSEGFGLNIAEALLHEKPVIATNYSGNVDFTGHEDSYPIDYKLVELGKHLGPYPPEALWAEPDVEDLAAKMRMVFMDQDEAARRGKIGRERILRDYSKKAIGDRLRARFDQLEVFVPSTRYINSSKPSVNCTYRYFNSDGPTISVVVPVYNIEPSLLTKCIESVINQTYHNWELILHDDASDRTDTIETLRYYKGIDTRIKVSFSEKN
jgi:glycosyltransferase involved in cell wall biosynthesis